jgi:NNP family nitrate/nitrite transporter-like MFS transporter
MFLAGAWALISLPSEGGGTDVRPFFAAFMLLFLTAGIGNGSVFHMVPTVFRKLHERSAKGKDSAEKEAAITAGDIAASVALGFTSAIAAMGLFFIPALVATSIQASGTPRLALVAFCVFYLTCVLTTWWWYRRPDAEARCD